MWLSSSKQLSGGKAAYASMHVTERDTSTFLRVTGAKGTSEQILCGKLPLVSQAVPLLSTTSHALTVAGSALGWGLS